ncbi:toprim domain-containing protein [Cupriavidus basilensis]
MFFADAGRELSDDEKLQRRQRAEQAKADAEADRNEHSRRAAQLASAILQAASKATAANPYLVNKGIAPTGLLYELPIKHLVELAGYHPHSDDAPLRGHVLLAPVSRNGKLATLKMIDENGRKSALRGGAKSGGYSPTCSLAEMKASAALLICEGVATAISVHAATGYPAPAALCAGNQKHVARAMRAEHPTAAIVICADIGNGQAHAEAAARAVRGRVALPVFADDAEINGESPTDFNDLHQLAGADAVRVAVEGAVAGAAGPEKVDYAPPEATTIRVHPDPLARPAPQPLIAKIEPEPYPLEALPSAIRAAVEEVQGFVQAPVPLVASCALSALSLAVQAHTDVQRAETLFC